MKLPFCRLSKRLPFDVTIVGSTFRVRLRKRERRDLAWFSDFPFCLVIAGLLHSRRAVSFSPRVLAETPPWPGYMHDGNRRSDVQGGWSRGRKDTYLGLEITWRSSLSRHTYS